MNVFLLILGLVLVIVGADALVNGSVAVAKRYRMPEFLIGLTVVGIGTSLPELVVSLIAGIEDKGGMAIGNVVGSNLSNTLLILGAAALIQPISISRSTQRIDIPYNMLVTLAEPSPAGKAFCCWGSSSATWSTRSGQPTGKRPTRRRRAPLRGLCGKRSCSLSPVSRDW